MVAELMSALILSSPPAARDAQLPLLTVKPTVQTTSFTGRLELRRVSTYGGCTTPPRVNEWLVLEFEGHTLPLKEVGPAEVAAIRADLLAPKPDRLPVSMGIAAPELKADALPRLGLEAGAQATAEGILAPLFYSGTVSMNTVYGLFVSRIKAP